LENAKGFSFEIAEALHRLTGQLLVDLLDFDLLVADLDFGLRDRLTFGVKEEIRGVPNAS
jgi:hypothetical protein